MANILIHVLIVVICIIAVGVVWLIFGRQISLVINWCFPCRPSPHPIDPMSIDGDSFTLGSWRWPLPRSDGFKLKITTDPQRRLVFCADGRAFTCGPVQKMWDDPVQPRYQFVPESGDVVSFTREIGRLPWPTPFTFYILGGAVPKAKRYIYDRLRWTKPSGASLEITWRDQFWWYREAGWCDTCNNRLVKIRITA